ncbi:hypothetical protein Tco_1103116 [Tanacetum coccineum]
MSFTLHSLFSLGTKAEHVGLSDIESQWETKTKCQIKLHLVRTDNVKNELVLKCEYVVRGEIVSLLKIIVIAGNDQRPGAAARFPWEQRPQVHNRLANTFVVLLRQQAERVKSIVEKAERDKRSAIIRAQDVRGDPDQRHKTFLRSFADPCLFTPKLVFPIAVLEHKYIKRICTGYLDSATEEAMEEFRRFEEEMEQ